MLKNHTNILTPLLNGYSHHAYFFCLPVYSPCYFNSNLCYDTCFQCRYFPFYLFRNFSNEHIITRKSRTKHVSNKCNNVLHRMFALTIVFLANVVGRRCGQHLADGRSVRVCSQHLAYSCDVNARLSRSILVRSIAD